MTKQSRERRLGFKEFLLSLFLIVIVWAAGDLVGIGKRAEPTLEPDPGGVIEVFFTAPSGASGAGKGGLDERLVALIDGAARSVDVAAFDFELSDVADALVRASARDVRVRLVTDSDYAGEAGPVTLQAAGIPVVTDDRDPFMHNKFVIVDGYQVWTGSWNLTENGTNLHDNNVVFVQSTKLAANYAAEFEEMFADRAFGPTSPDNTPYPQLDLNGTRVETIFEAEGDAEKRIVDLIREAERSIHFMAFVMTDDDIARVLIAQHRAGLAVSGVMESRNTADLGSDFPALRQAGVDVLEDGNPYLLHHKTLIVDEAIVVTGSYNFSASAADNNDENVLIIHSPEIARAYMDEFARVYAVAAAQD
ncbi:MAG: phospholipase [Anaerolineae bacterium]|nr:phospholipase [Anaerolineae bacterium]